jgi:hypothetical protein
MNLVIAAVLAASQTSIPTPHPALGQPSWIVATVHHSEWCPAGHVRLDLRTGQYVHVAGAQRHVCNDTLLERPVVAGTLRSEQLERLLAAFARVQVEKLEKPVCRDGGRPKEIIIGNGGTPLLVLTTGAETGWAPENLACWSDAANALHEALEDIFYRPQKR